MIDYHFSNDFFRNIDAMIYTCGYENCSPGHSYGPVLRNGCLIHYVLSGCGIYRARGRLFRPGQGDAFLICPGELIYYEADRSFPWSYAWIGLQGIKVREYLERTSLLDNLCVHYGQDDQMRLCHEKMFEADKLSQNRDLIMNSIMYEYLFLLARKFPNPRHCASTHRPDYAEEAVTYIESHYCDPITVSDIASHLNINRSYLHRVFKAFTGCSIQSCLSDCRLRQATLLLKNTDQPVGIVARSAGYADPLYFSRMFRQKYSVSPSEYRRQKTAMPQCHE